MGALISKLYTYKARPWEIKSIETISLANDPFLPFIKIDLLNRKYVQMVIEIPGIKIEQTINKFNLLTKKILIIIKMYILADTRNLYKYRHFQFKTKGLGAILQFKTKGLGAILQFKTKGLGAILQKKKYIYK